ncbi:hypothetical protein GCM10010319_24100 [Streptomyces blastmyceticus]|uniref:Uncharacterized protein n=1 Tax=Streptomyces blastmyceticus TaxID=68180 RepID=A0ABP3GKR9_9ACTN
MSAVLTRSRARGHGVVTASVLALALCGGLAACFPGGGQAPDVSVTDASAAQPTGQSAEPMQASKPTRLRIPSAGFVCRNPRRRQGAGDPERLQQ